MTSGAPAATMTPCNSPLHLAAAAGRHRVVRVHLQYGAYVDPKALVNETPLHWAASKGHTPCVFELLMGGADAVAFLEGETPLFIAAAHNHPGVAEQLLAASADRCRPNLDSFSPFDLAAKRGHATIFKAFLETGTNVDAATDRYGWTALHSAACVDEPVIDDGAAARVLLEAGADVNARESCYGTPVHIALDCCDRVDCDRVDCDRVASIGTIRALSEGGADVSARAEGNPTPLHTACKHSDAAAVELLLCWGVYEKLTNDDGDTPSDVIGASSHYATYISRAEAERSWRRRRWFVLSRYDPTRMKIEIENGSNSSISKGCSFEVATVSCEDSSRDDEETEDQMMVDWRDLVGRLVGLGSDSVFRLVGDFL